MSKMQKGIFYLTAIPGLLIILICIVKAADERYSSSALRSDYFDFAILSWSLIAVAVIMLVINISHKKSLEPNPILSFAKRLTLIISIIAAPTAMILFYPGSYQQTINNFIPFMIVIPCVGFGFVWALHAFLRFVCVPIVKYVFSAVPIDYSKISQQPALVKIQFAIMVLLLIIVIILAVLIFVPAPYHHSPIKF